MEYIVRVWKFDEHHYKEKEITIKFNPNYIPKVKLSILGVLLLAWKEWKSR